MNGGSKQDDEKLARLEERVNDFEERLNGRKNATSCPRQS